MPKKSERPIRNLDSALSSAIRKLIELVNSAALTGVRRVNLKGYRGRHYVRVGCMDTAAMADVWRQLKPAFVAAYAACQGEDVREVIRNIRTAYFRAELEILNGTRLVMSLDPASDSALYLDQMMQPLAKLSLARRRLAVWFDEPGILIGGSPSSGASQRQQKLTR